MASFIHVVNPFFASAQKLDASAQVPAAQFHVESASFTHALIALAAKLACVDGAPNKAEYAAFHALFVEEEGDRSAQARSLFIKRITDNSTALQYARQIAAVTVGKSELHRDLMRRLLHIATADAALNAAELELLRAIADAFGMDREQFRALVAQTMVPASASPYAVLGISPRVNDDELREHYMARVRKLHPDRYHAAGASSETITMLSDQLAAVNAAYKTIQQQRAKKSSRPDSGWWGIFNAKGASASSA